MKSPQIETVTAVEPIRLQITCTPGDCHVVDLAEPIQRLKVLAPLQDTTLFARVQVGEWGHSVVWNDAIDLGADRLYERCKEQAGDGKFNRRFLDKRQR